ncbi:hypothetical protein SY83_03290 [Paenibacillus swuensis]|uniref:ABC transmembrane type-1 domain-containing protein n=1 Tax=Paenibacillus swuensis TaxID=1178515 RepID=A0A172TFE2_9BACL|nr:carbohydrate ABC transporter permease [Paenibacillus swuensis]ANE45503.1 hypothetical protein SY83_03290 [Paenibacillus swuensis]
MLNRYGARRKGIWFDWVNRTFLFLLAMTTVIPLLYVAWASVTVHGASNAAFPGFTLAAYRYLLGSEGIVRSLANTFWITTIGTVINVLLTCLTAYPLAQASLPFRKGFLLFIACTMICWGGMIPDYLVVSQLGLLDTYWALWLPAGIQPLLLFVLVAFFRKLPSNVTDSAKLDGCGHLDLLLRVILPLSVPPITACAMMYAAAHWNDFMSPLLYVSDVHRWPIQIWLHQVILLSAGGIEPPAGAKPLPLYAIRNALIILAVIPLSLLIASFHSSLLHALPGGSVKE